MASEWALYVLNLMKPITFLDNNKKLDSPPWASLKELEYASLQLEKDGIIYDPSYKKWLDMLVAPGSSLGGAPLKAGVVDNKNNLWIAKFPSRNDTKNVGAWKMVVHELPYVPHIYGGSNYS